MRVKRKRMLPVFLIVLLAALGALGLFWYHYYSGTGKETFAPTEGKRILVIETTDLHGNIVDASSGNRDTIQYRLAYIADLVAEARSSTRYDDVILLDGGDIYQGTPISDMNSGAIMRAAFDEMHYDAVALGNHEFDWEVTEFAADQEGTIAPYQFGDFAGDAKTPVLVSNLYDASSGKKVSFTKDYVVLEKSGVRIAVIGYIPNYRSAIMSAKIKPYTIDDDTDKLAALVKKVNEKERPDAVILLAHASPLPLAEAMDPQQVDLVAGGHSHEITAERASNGIPCIQGYSHGQGFAQAELVFHEDGEVTVEDVKYTSITDNKKLLYDTRGNASHLDSRVLAVSKAGSEEILEKMEDVLGTIDVPIKKEKGIGSSAAGNWVTGLLLRAEREFGAVIAFYNNSGIRSGFEIPQGEGTRRITAYDIYTMVPFGNKLLLYDLNGKELAQHLVNGLKNSSCGDQMSGLSFTYSASGDEDMKRSWRDYTILSITLDDGTEVDVNDTETLYRVCINSFSAAYPGSVFEGKEPIIPQEDALIDNECMIEALRQEAQENSGCILVDTRARSKEIELE